MLENSKKEMKSNKKRGAEADSSSSQCVREQFSVTTYSSDATKLVKESVET